MEISRKHLGGAFLAFTLLTTPPALAQPLQAGLPPEIASADVTVEQWEDIQTQVRLEARRAGIAEAALMAAAERAGVNLAASGNFSAARLRDAIISQLARQAETISELTDRLAVLAGAADPINANLLTFARIAIEEGRLQEADRFLHLAEESDLVAIAVAEARVERQRARLAEAVLMRSEIGDLNHAIEIADLRAAAARYEAKITRMDPLLAPNDWARDHFNLGIVLALLTQAGDEARRSAALAALEEAAAGYERVDRANMAARTRQLAEALRLPDPP